MYLELVLLTKWIERAQTFFNVVAQVKERLGAQPVPLQVPIGAEETFKGVVDLISNKAIVWNDDTQGMTYDEIPIPEDLVDVVAEWREKIDRVCCGIR